MYLIENVTVWGNVNNIKLFTLPQSDHILNKILKIILKPLHPKKKLSI